MNAWLSSKEKSALKHPPMTRCSKNILTSVMMPAKKKPRNTGLYIGMSLDIREAPFGKLIPIFYGFMQK